MKDNTKELYKSSEERKGILVDLMQDKKAKDIVSLDLRAIPEAVADFFIVCHGDSTTQVKAIVDHVMIETKMREIDTVLSSEGTINSEWALVDFGDIIIHVFLNKIRDVYQLEELWSDAAVTEYENLD